MADDSMPQKLRKMHEDLIDIGCFNIDLIKEAADMVERLTKPLTLDECCGILNENEHGFEYWDEPWEADGDHLYNGMDALTQFEAKALARAYAAQKEVGFG